jgi:2-polyprenyl-3-methyl-5-hydroxy-6-metoxy-1,4-benzoquinol methylase
MPPSLNQPAKITQDHFHKIATQFDDLYEAENRGALRRRLDGWLRASIYRRFELTFEQLGDLGGKRILDVGCGGGRYSIMAAQLGAAHVTAVDFAPKMIELGLTLARKQGIDESKIRFVCGDAAEVELESPVNAAIVMGVFDYVEDPETFLRAILDKVSERIVASFPVKWSVWTPQRLIRYRLFKNCPLYFYSKARIEGLLATIGVGSFKIMDAHRDYVVVIDK